MTCQAFILVAREGVTDSQELSHFRFKLPERNIKDEVVIRVVTATLLRLVLNTSRKLLRIAHEPDAR